MKLLLALLLAAGGLAAQTVTVENLTPNRFEGWKRTNVDVLPAFESGEVDGVQYVLGRVTGDGTRALDIRVGLDGFQKKTFDLSKAKARQFSVGMIPADPAAYFGGPVTVADKAMTFVSIEVDGAGISSHLRARYGKMMVADLWMTWYPDQASWAAGELLLTCSNPSVPNMREDVTDTYLKFGDSLTLVPGHAPGQAVISGTQRFGNGQARLLPVTFLWTRHLNVAQDWATVGAVANLGISAVGIKDLFHDGNRPYPESSTGTYPHRWAAPKFAESVRRLHSWEDAVIGPAPFSGQTGSQEDQTFQRGEALLPGGPAGADIVTYLGAAKYANRPCHHLEFSGEIIDGANQTERLVYWDGRNHWHLGVSPNRLGKGEKTLEIDDTGGWSGPDVEHWLLSTLFAGHRYTGSPALGWLIRHQSHVYMLQWTHTPGWATSQAYASRAIGWEGLGAVGIFRENPDRQLARRVKQHFRDRWLNVLQPRLDGLLGNIWDARADLRLGFRNGDSELLNPPPAGWMPWQQSIGAYGLDLAGRVFDIPEAQDLAFRAAEACLTHNWIRLPGTSRFRGTGNQPFSHGIPMTEQFWLGLEPFNQVVWTWGPSWFELTWDVPALWVVKQHSGGENVKANEVWEQIWVESQAGGSWFPPGSHR